MSKKKIAYLISAIVLIAAAVTAVIVFHTQIAAFFENLRSKLQKSPSAPEPPFTDEEREAFADI